MSLHAKDDLPTATDSAGAQDRERAMLLIWALLGVLLIVVFSAALWA